MKYIFGAILCISCFKNFHPQSWPSSHIHLPAPSPMLCYNHSDLLKVCWNVSNIETYVNCVRNLLHSMWFESVWLHYGCVLQRCSLFALTVFPGQENFQWNFSTCQRTKSLYCCTRFTWRVQYEVFCIRRNHYIVYQIQKTAVTVRWNYLQSDDFTNYSKLYITIVFLIDIVDGYTLLKVVSIARILVDTAGQAKAIHL